MLSWAEGLVETKFTVSLGAHHYLLITTPSVCFKKLMPHCHPIGSKSKTNIVNNSQAFSRALRRLQAFASSLDWLSGFVVPFEMGRWRRGGLMVSALVSGSSGLGSSPHRGHCAVFLGKTLQFILIRCINGYRRTQ